MKSFWTLFRSNKPTKCQEVIESHAGNRNLAVLGYAKRLGYPVENIRRALLHLNGISMRNLANKKRLATYYGAIKGTNRNAQAMESLAVALGLTVEELFGKDQVCTCQCVPDKPESDRVEASS